MNEKFMDIALLEAKKAFKKEETPVGCVIVKNNKIISKAHNKKNKTNRIIDHSEIIAITKANKKLKNWRLEGCDLYVTLEPCPMCASAIEQARINNVYTITSNNDTNNNEIITKIFKNTNFIKYDGNKESELLLKKFFQKRR